MSYSRSTLSSFNHNNNNNNGIYVNAAKRPFNILISLYQFLHAANKMCERALHLIYGGVRAHTRIYGHTRCTKWDIEMLNICATRMLSVAAAPPNGISIKNNKTYTKWPLTKFIISIIMRSRACAQRARARALSLNCFI